MIVNKFNKFHIVVMYCELALLKWISRIKALKVLGTVTIRNVFIFPSFSFSDSKSCKQPDKTCPFCSHEYPKTRNKLSEKIVVLHMW